MKYDVIVIGGGQAGAMLRYQHCVSINSSGSILLISNEGLTFPTKDHHLSKNFLTGITPNKKSLF